MTRRRHPYRTLLKSDRRTRVGEFFPRISTQICAAQRDRDFGTPGLGQGSYFREVSGYNISNVRKLIKLKSYLWVTLSL